MVETRSGKKGKERGDDTPQRGGKKSKVVGADTTLRRIVVDYIPRDMSRDSLITVLGRFGEIEEGPTGFDSDPMFNVVGNRRSYVTYKSPAPAEAAMAKPIKLVGENGEHRIFCRWARLPPGRVYRPPDPYLAYVEDERSGRRRGLQYGFEDTFGKVSDLPNLRAKQAVSRVSHSILAFSSYSGGRFLFACSGIVLEEVDDSFFAITSASLVKEDSKMSHIAADLKIQVRTSGAEATVGNLVRLDWHYNIALVSFSKPKSNETGVRCLPLHISDFSESERVFPVGRHYSSCDLTATSGNVISKVSKKFNCQELMIINSKITKCGIGGPLINESGMWVGVTFFDDEETPFLPGICVRRCVDQLMKDKSVFHPWTGMILRTFGTMPEPEKMLDKLDDLNGLVVLQAVEGSPAYLSGIREGDIIVKIGEVSVSSVAEFASELLLVSEKFKTSRASASVQVSMKRINGETFGVRMALEELPECQYYSWPVPRWRFREVLPRGMELL